MIKKTIATLALTTFAALACPKKVGELEINNFWVRGMRGGPNTAAYMVISNKGLMADKLIKVEGTDAASVEIHDHIHENGIAKMRRVEGITIEPGSDVALEKGGKHIMLMGIKQTFEDKKEIPLTLHFEKAGKIEVVFPVNKE
jgi:periplasmic copper chaperone A